jgi:hypothetical protein
VFVDGIGLWDQENKAVSAKTFLLASDKKSQMKLSHAK